jgi:hypothetical protein
MHDIAVEEDDDALLPLDVLPPERRNVHVLHTDGAAAHPIPPVPPVNPALPEMYDDDGAMGLEPPQAIALNDHVYARRHDDHIPEPQPEPARQGHRYRPRAQQFAGRQFPPQVNAFSIGAMDKTCEFCQALLFKGETKLLQCCHKGKVMLPPLAPYPDEMRNLLTENTAQSRHFLSLIRQYNSAMAFASFVGKSPVAAGRGPRTFRLHGQLYHKTGTLHPEPGTPAMYSQLYIIEADQAVESRIGHRENQKCRLEIMALLTTILQRINPFAAAYKHMLQVEQEQMEIAAQNNTVPPTVTMYMKRGHDQRRYNEPRHNEVAAIFVSNDGAPPPERDVIVHPKDAPLANISHLSANIDPMVYPILFPHGEYGWYNGMQQNPERRTEKRTKISCLQFYSHRLANRGMFSPIFHSGLLFQQYVVDAYVRVETNNLN